MILQSHHNQIDFLQEFCDTYYLGITIKENNLPSPLLQFNYSDDFDFADGEEGTNGDIYYYFNNELIFTRTIYAGDGEDYNFTALGVSIYTDLLKQYLNYIISKING